MDIKEYTKLAARTRPDLNSDFKNQLHMVLGLATEAGELLDAYKKDLAYGKTLDTVNVGEELGDLLWYWVGLCDILGLDSYKVMEVNINKLKARYPDKFTTDHANNRDLTVERQILMELGY